MIQFTERTFANGLRVLVYPNYTTPFATVNILYNVGARDESPERTGFAHLFEHLMFGGSVNVPDFDEPIENGGGHNNAFTSNDMTNYYDIMPKQNLEVALWLESDRMMSLAFNKKSLDVQRKVVSEEFKEHYLNKPYGDVSHILRRLAYTSHPYKWPTIGLDLKQIEEATLDQVKEFFYQHYLPNNAIMCIGGNVEAERAFDLAEKWFAGLPAGKVSRRDLPIEPIQLKPVFERVEADVPVTKIYRGYKMCARFDNDYYATDLLSDILGYENHSLLHTALVEKSKMFNSINAYTWGSIDPGMLIFYGDVANGVDVDDADNALVAELDKLLLNGVEAHDVERVINNVEAQIEYEMLSVPEVATNLCFYAMFDRPERINEEGNYYRKVTPDDILKVAKKILRPQNSTVLHYKARNGIN